MKNWDRSVNGGRERAASDEQAASGEAVGFEKSEKLARFGLKISTMMREVRSRVEAMRRGLATRMGVGMRKVRAGDGLIQRTARGGWVGGANPSGMDQTKRARRARARNTLSMRPGRPRGDGSFLRGAAGKTGERRRACGQRRPQRTQWDEDMEEEWKRRR